MYKSALFLFFPFSSVYQISYVYSIISEVYAPMSKRNFEFDVENICYYQKYQYDFVYVRPCEKNKKCEMLFNDSENLYSYYSYRYPRNFLNVGICTEYSEEFISFGSPCENDDDCITSSPRCEKNDEFCFTRTNNLKCLEKKCSLGVNNYPIYIGDIPYCPDNLIGVSSSENSRYKCEERKENEMLGLCYLKKDSGYKRAFPDYMKVCGEITFDKGENNYEILNITMNSIGSVEDGKFVENELACKSGFALKFYPNGEISIPSSKTDDWNNHYRCVQYNGIKYKKNGEGCIINYILDNKNYSYDTKKAKIDYYYCHINNLFRRFPRKNYFLKEKLLLFKQYVDKLNELKDECTKNKYYDEPFTCKNDELRKLYYFYNHTDEYLLYKKEDEITEYILQKEYPSYGVKLSKTDRNEYLKDKTCN